MKYGSIPSPSQGVWHLGPIPLRAYAFCILVGIGIAIVIGQRRFRQRGGDPVVVVDIATWAVPFGVVGGRLYHVFTAWGDYFGSGGEPIKALYIWQGGLGIWGAVVLGGVGAWIGCRRHGVKLPPFADAIAPGIVLAQAFGRWGNWFNNELYGHRTGEPWGLKVYQWDSSAGHAIHDPAGHAVVLGFFQPTFLYESVWDVIAFVLLIWLDRRLRLGHGRVFALYAVIYSIGRGVIETLRIDEAHHILGLRLNVWTSIIVCLGGLTYLIVSTRLKPGRETDVYRPGHAPASATPNDSPEPSSTEASTKVETSTDKTSTDKTSTDKTSTDKPSTDKPKVDSTELAVVKSDKAVSVKDDSTPKKASTDTKVSTDKKVSTEKKVSTAKPASSAETGSPDDPGKSTESGVPVVTGSSAGTGGDEVAVPPRGEA